MTSGSLCLKTSQAKVGDHVYCIPSWWPRLRSWGSEVIARIAVGYCGGGQRLRKKKILQGL